MILEILTSCLKGENGIVVMQENNLILRRYVLEYLGVCPSISNEKNLSRYKIFAESTW